jgi:hypothetical protein
MRRIWRFARWRLCVWLPIILALLGYRWWLGSVVKQANAEEAQQQAAFWTPLQSLQYRIGRLASEVHPTPEEVESEFGVKLSPVPTGAPDLAIARFIESETSRTVELRFVAGRLQEASFGGGAPYAPLQPPAPLLHLKSRTILFCFVLGIVWAVALMLSTVSSRRGLAVETSFVAALLAAALALIALEALWNTWAFSGLDNWKPPLHLAFDLAAFLALPICLITATAFSSTHTEAASPPLSGCPSGADAAPTLSVESPDWSTVTIDPHCPLCEYNLRGLQRSQCPECGYSFTWPEVFGTQSLWLRQMIEHARINSLWTIGRTLCRTIRPGTFFRRLTASDPIRPRRLLVHALYVVTVSLLPCLAADVANLGVFTVPQPWTGLPDQWLHYAADVLNPTVIHFFIAWIPSDDSALLLWPAFVIGWAGLSISGLWLLRSTMTRAGIRTGHLVRCVIYSADSAVWVTPFLVLTLVPSSGTMSARSIRWLVTAACCLLASITTYRLSQAARLYLRLPRAVLVVWVVEATLALAVATAAGCYAAWR